MRARSSKTRLVTLAAAAAGIVAFGVAAAGVADARTGPSAERASAGHAVADHHGPDRAGHRVPRLAYTWRTAWKSDNPNDLAALFTRDAVYTDLAVGKVSRGRAGVASWQAGTHELIANPDIKILDAFRSGDRILIDGLYTGHIHGAPRPFALHMATVLHLRGQLIQSDTDYYNLADLLRQSGLPPTWTPPN